MRRQPKPQTALVAYIRVSTAEQGISGLGMEAQREAIRRYAEQSGYVIAAEIAEVVSTRKERPEFEAALRLCEQCGHTLAVARLDRLSRDLLTIAQLQQSEVNFVAVDNPGASKFMVQILAAVAENERDMISERTKAALARAKANGTRLGAPDPVASLAPAIIRRSLAAEEFRAKIRPRIQQMREASATYQEIADQLNREGFPTPSGRGQWATPTVMRVLKTPLGLSLAPTADDAPACASANQAEETANDDQLPLFQAANRL